jgi:hypothetical protein
MTEDSQDFQQLQRLLTLKRYEQPPPGYFHHFPREIILRIKAGELGEVEAKWWAFDGSWLQWLWAACERRPVLAGGAGVALCGFFAAATLISGSGDAPAVGVSQNMPGNQYVAVQAAPEAPVDDLVISADFPGLTRMPAAAPSVFGMPQTLQQWQLQPQPVNFSPRY